MSKGVLTGCNAEQEWMLKWWWENYSKHNDYPITFCDFGMSLGARKWCETKGNILSFDPKSISTDKNHSAPWSNKVSLSTLNKRSVWFSKPLILSQSPYNKTLWTDVDCEILKDITPLFEMTESIDGFAIAYDTEENTKHARKYNLLKANVQALQAGVIVFKKTSPVISAWIDHCLKHIDTEASDQTALSHLFAKKPFDITILSNKYNWLISEFSSEHIAIIHHTGASRKRKLLSEMKFHE